MSVKSGGARVSSRFFAIILVAHVLWSEMARKYEKSSDFAILREKTRELDPLKCGITGPTRFVHVFLMGSVARFLGVTVRIALCALRATQ